MNKIAKYLSLLFILLYWIDWRVEAALLFLTIVSVVISRYESRQPLIFTYHDMLFVLYAIFVVLTNRHDGNFGNIMKEMVLFIWAIQWCFKNIEHTEQYQNQIITSIGIVCLFIAYFIFFHDKPGHFNFSLSYIITKSRYSFLFIYKDYVGATTIASMFAVGFTFLIVRLFKKSNIFLIGITAFTFLLITISGGRSSWISIICISVTIVYLKTDLISPKKLIILGLVFVGIIVVFILIVPYIPIFFTPDFQRRLDAFSDPENNWTVRVRFIYWGRALAIILSHPWGVGFWAYFNQYGRTAHNELLGQLLGVGIGGTLVYLSLFVISFIELRKLRHYQPTTDDFQIFSYSFFIIIFFVSITENYSISSRFLFYPLIWIMFGTLSSKLRFLKGKTI